MGEFNLIKFEGKAIEKLIDVVSKAIGTLYKPRAMRKEADAKAYEIETIERAKSRAIAEGKLVEADTYDRIQERLLHREVRRQRNIDNVSEIAAQQLNNDNSASDEPIDEDWTSRFFNIVEDVSDGEMQELWGRILAGEVRQPKSYSLRTLELLKNLTKREAEAFTNASNYVISSWNSPFIYKGQVSDFLDKHGLSFEERLLLTEIGLLQSDVTITRGLKQEEQDSLIYFESGRYIIKALKKANTTENRIEIFRFTKIGEELLKLMNPNPSEQYVRDFCFRLQAFGLDIEYAFIESRLNEQIQHTLPWLRFTPT
ncbi:MAG: DUF2806 domain-containing protein [Bacteroidetes bacterium]|nr:DUF2806 domain-containing protein [Bacteroidota bacterium]